MNERLVSRYLFPLHERLKGKPTFRLLAELEASQWLPPRRLEEYRLRRLRRFLEFVHEHVPYCRALFDEHGLRPRSVHSLEDLGHLPFLTRDILQTRFDDLRARATLPGVHRRSSGGSTGTPVTVLVDMERMGMGEAGRRGCAPTAGTGSSQGRGRSSCGEPPPGPALSSASASSGTGS